MSDSEIIDICPPDDSLLVADTKTAKNIDITTRTLFNWDRSPKMAAQGWPQPVKINGRNYRRLGDLRRFFATVAMAGRKALEQVEASHAEAP